MFEGDIGLIDVELKPHRVLWNLAATFIDQREVWYSKPVQESNASDALMQVIRREGWGLWDDSEAYFWGLLRARLNPLFQLVF